MFIIKIPYTDVYCSTNNGANDLKESKYLIPDFIYPEEVIASFPPDDFKGVYNYLKNQIGLDIIPKDLLPYAVIYDGHAILKSVSVIDVNEISFFADDLDIKRGK